jgi:hypothetical protein
MPMKISLVLQRRRPLNRGEAWACFTANIALPGSGSLIAGRVVGYFQILLALIGLGISLITTVLTFVWYLKNYHRLNASMDPFASLIEFAHHLIQPALGFAIFIAAVLWAMVTSWTILRSTRQ